MPTVICKCGAQFVHLDLLQEKTKCPSCGEDAPVKPTGSGTDLPTAAQICAKPMAADCEVVKIDAGLAFAALASCVSQAFARLDEGNIEKCRASLTEAMGVIERSTNPIVLMRPSGEMNVMTPESPSAVERSEEPACAAQVTVSDNPAPIGEMAMRYLMNDLSVREVVDGWSRDLAQTFLDGTEIGKPIFAGHLRHLAYNAIQKAIRFALSDRKLWERIRDWQDKQSSNGEG